MNFRNNFAGSFFSLAFVLFFSVCSSNLYSQYGIAMPFLRTTPSAFSQGIGECGVALSDYSPFSIHNNPAHLGIFAESNSATLGFYPAKTSLFSNIQNQNQSNSLGFNAGYNYGKKGDGLPFALGVGYLYENVDMGEFTRTDASGKVLGKYKGYETAQSFTIAASTEYWIKAAVGLTFKSAVSHLETAQVTGISSQGLAYVFDVGLFLNAPFVKSLELNNSMKFNFDMSVGLDFANFGTLMTYRSENMPMPRTSTMGYALLTSLDMNILNKEFKVIQLDWTAEVEDLLVYKDALDDYYYSSVFQDMNFTDNLILQKSTGNVIVKHGIRAGFFDILQFYFGKKYDEAHALTNAYGIGLKANGMFKLINAFSKTKFHDFLENHIDLSFYYSKNELNSVLISSFSREFYNVVFGVRNLW